MGKGRLRLGFLVFFVFLGLLGVSAGAIHYGLRQVRQEVQSSQAFRAGWVLAQGNPTLLDAIGVPQLASFTLEHFRDFIAGRQPWVLNVYNKEIPEATGRGMRSRWVRRNEIEVPIVGPRGSGRLTIHAVKDRGDWNLQKLVADIRGHWEPIDLLEPAAAGKVTRKTDPDSAGGE